MITRFAPSPTGPLHLGHAFSAITAHDLAQAHGGRFLLRIEDLDGARSRPEWEAQIYDDLAWLGLTWEKPVLRQSENEDAYTQALNRLTALGLTFACTCNRADIRAALTAPQENYGPDGLIYPGTCRDKGRSADGAAIRLDARKARAHLPETLTWYEGEEETRVAAAQLVDDVGDIVLWRKDTGRAAYHLAVVVDDAAQGVTDVVRGDDLRDATLIHVALQTLLSLPTPRYHHHRLIRDDAGKRLAKRDDARALSLYREQGATPADIRARVGL
ncbi:MAG: tRNA glutamyl-Q(34) synthetase GluQRS [Pseudomonadota bacterium]